MVVLKEEPVPLPLLGKKPFVDIASHNEQKPTAEKAASTAPAQTPAVDVFEPSKPQKTLDSALISKGPNSASPAPGPAEKPAIPAEDIQLKALLKKD
jgi:hypothetical protein